MLGFFRPWGWWRTDAVLSLRSRFITDTRDISDFWKLTPREITEVINGRTWNRNKRLEDLYRRDELLAFNIGALCRTAINAPLMFPKTPDEAFGRRQKGII